MSSIPYEHIFNTDTYTNFHSAYVLSYNNAVSSIETGSSSVGEKSKFPVPAASRHLEQEDTLLWICLSKHGFFKLGPLGQFQVTLTFPSDMTPNI